MQDADLLVQLAAIAGVFVGFGALIAVRSGGASDAHEVAYIRSIVSIAVWVAVAALAPVTLSRYGLAGHDLWLACSVLALVLVLGVWAVNSRTPEMRQEFAAISQAQLMREGAINALLLVRASAEISWTERSVAARLAVWRSRQRWWARCSVGSAHCGRI